MLERELEAKVVRYAKEQGILTYKFVSPNNRGVPDRIFMRDGEVVFLEFKKPGSGKTSALQHRELGRIWDAGIQAYVVDNYEKAVEILISIFWTE